MGSLSRDLRTESRVVSQVKSEWQLLPVFHHPKTGEPAWMGSEDTGRWIASRRTGMFPAAAVGEAHALEAFLPGSLSLAWMAFPARVRAQDPTSSPGYSTVDNLSGAMTLTPGGGSYLLFNKQTGRAVGIPTGYSRIGIRHAIFEDGPHQVFGDAHFLITDTSRYGFNTGVGYRTMIDGAIWGVQRFL